MDPSACSDVLLEAVGPSAPAHRDVDQVGRQPSQRHHHGSQQTRFVEYGAHAGDTTGDVESVVEGPGACLRPRAMDRACRATMAILDRQTALCGPACRRGVGGGGETPPPTQLCTLHAFCTSIE